MGGSIGELVEQGVEARRSHLLDIAEEKSVSGENDQPLQSPVVLGLGSPHEAVFTRDCATALLR